MATKVTLYPSPKITQEPSENPLPQLLHTPSGLALLELQGTINTPFRADQIEDDASDQPGSYETPIGRLVFPDHETGTSGSGPWQKRVYLYVGKHQRLTGEVKALPKAIAVIRRRTLPGTSSGSKNTSDAKEELEITEIVKWKIIFSQRPEPVGASIINA